MDISNLTTSTNEQEGKWFQVELYGKKQPFALKILGNESDEVIFYQREQLKKLKEIGKEAEEMTDDEFTELLDAGEEAIITRIVGISSVRQKGKFNSEFELINEAVILDGKELKNDKTSYKTLVEKIPAIKDFILKKSRDRSNFLD